MECLTINDPSRLLIALISDTGMRPNEALGLVAEDIVLNTETRYLCVKEHPWRRLKNIGSERLIP